MTMTGISAGIALRARSVLAVMRRLAGVVFVALKKQNARTLAAGGIALIATHIALGLDAGVLDLSGYRAGADAQGGSDEAFL